jgi:hypothetical protein
MDKHNETVKVHKLKKLAAHKKDEAADFKAAGVAATINGGWPMPVVTTHDKSQEVRSMILLWKTFRSPTQS